MNPESFKAWSDAAMPMIDRGIGIGVGGTVLWVAFRIPWLRFFAWISAPTMVSLVFVATFCLSGQSILSQESTFQYVPVYLLFALKFLFGTFGQSFMAVKAYLMIPEKKGKPDDEPPKP